MPQRLTSKQECFAAAVASGSNASEAYRRCYDAGRMKDETVWRKAGELMENGRVTAKIAELRKPAIEKTSLTIEHHLKNLKEMAEEARSLGQLSAAIRAEELCGRATGLYVERKRIEGPGGGPLSVALTIDESILSAIKDILAHL